jgi:hypothetical protein
VVVVVVPPALIDVTSTGAGCATDGAGAPLATLVQTRRARVDDFLPPFSAHPGRAMRGWEPRRGLRARLAAADPEKSISAAASPAASAVANSGASRGRAAGTRAFESMSVIGVPTPEVGCEERR